jgi:hypothetical protein
MESRLFVLGHAHISEAPSCDHSMEFIEAMFEGDRPRRLGRRVAVPSAEPGDDPTGPFEAPVGMGVFLQPCGALDFGVEFVENGHFVSLKATVAGSQSDGSGAFGSSIDPGLNDCAELLLGARGGLAPSARTPSPAH